MTDIRRSVCPLIVAVVFGRVLPLKGVLYFFAHRDNTSKQVRFARGLGTKSAKRATKSGGPGSEAGTTLPTGGMIRVYLSCSSSSNGL